MERKVLISSPWDPVRGHMGMVQSCIRGDLDRTLGSTSLLKGWSNTGTGFLETWSIPQACQYLRGIWTMPLTTCFNLVSPEVLRQLDYRIVVGPFQLKQSYSVLFCPVLFYFNRYIVELSPVTVSSVNRKTEKFKYILLFPSKKKNNIEKTF